MDRQEEVKLTENLNLSENDSLALQNDLKEGSPIKEEQDSQIASDTNAKKSKGTKRKASIDLQLYTCEVCQVKLNSASQAYQHFQGKTHRGKVKMLEMAAEVQAPSVNTPTINTSATPNSTSTLCQDTSALPPSSLEHYCTICQKIFNSKNQAEQHFSGKAHRHKLSENAIANIQGSNVKSQLPIENNVPSGFGNGSAAVVDVKLGGNVKSELFSCVHCHITLNSERQYEQHVKGLRHKIIVGKAKPPPPPQAEEPGWQDIRYKKLATAITTVGILSNCGNTASINPGGTRLGQYYCNECDVSVNSPLQLQQHLTSPKHKAKADGTVPVKRKSAAGRGRGAQILRGSSEIIRGAARGQGTLRGTGRGRGRGNAQSIGQGLIQGMARGTGRGTGRGRGVPSLSSNFIKGGEMKPYQQSTPGTQVSTHTESMNNTVQNNQNIGYIDAKNSQSSGVGYMNYLQNNPYPAHATMYPAHCLSPPTQVYK